MSGRRRAEDVGAFAQEWIWRHSKARRLARFVLLYIGRFVRRVSTGEFETPPLRIEEIADPKEGTGLSVSTIHRALDDLERGSGEIDVIRPDRKGEAYRYRLRRQMTLPMAVDPPRHLSQRQMPSVKVTGESPSLSPTRETDDELSAGQLSPISLTAGESAADYLVRTSTLVRTTSSHSENTKAEVEALLGWLRSEHPKLNNGAALTVSADDVAALLSVVLVPPRDLARLRAMFVVMWTVTPQEDEWLASRKVRGLALMRHAADRFDRISRERESGAAARSVWDDVLDRAEAKVTRSDLYTWLRPLRLVEDRGDVLVVEAAPMHVSWVEKYLDAPLRAAVEDVRPGTRIEYRAAAKEASA
jgi:hypothetical protein